MTTLPVWADTPAPQRQPLLEDTSADWCVVGLGGSGLSAIAELRRLGASVVGLDAGIVAGGAAGRNAGLLLAGLSPFHHAAREQLGREIAVEAYGDTLDEISRLMTAWPDVTQHTGSLRIAVDDDEAADVRAHIAALAEDGFVGEPYSGPEGDGMVIADDGVTDPLALCRAEAAAVEADGARLFEATAVVEVGARQVMTASGAAVTAGRVLVAVDGGLELLVPSLDRLVRTTRLQMLATDPEVGVSFPRPIYHRFGYDYLRQLPNGRVIAGGRRDHFADDEWSAPASPSDAVQAEIEEWVRSLGVTAPVTHRWAGRVAYTDDHLPVVTDVNGVLVCGAYSGTGNVVGRLCARAIVDEAAGLGPRPRWMINRA